MTEQNNLQHDVENNLKDYLVNSCVDNAFESGYEGICHNKSSPECVIDRHMDETANVNIENHIESVEEHADDQLLTDYPIDMYSKAHNLTCDVEEAISVHESETNGAADLAVGHLCINDGTVAKAVGSPDSLCLEPVCTASVPECDTLSLRDDVSGWEYHDTCVVSSDDAAIDVHK